MELKRLSLTWVPSRPVSRTAFPLAFPLAANAGTPEIEGRCQEEIDRAIMARDYTRALVVGKMVALTAVGPDRYKKRVDAYVSIDGRDLGEALIAGLARPHTGGQRAGWCG